MPPTATGESSRRGRLRRLLALGGGVIVLGIAGFAVWPRKRQEPPAAPRPPASIALSADPQQDASAPPGLVQTPGCGEVLVSTVCGTMVRCSDTGEDRMLFPLDGVGPAKETSCSRALVRLRKELRETAKRPLERGARAGDPFVYARRFGCVRPTLDERQRAYSEVLRRVRSEGIARLSRMSDASARAYWNELLLHRFDFVSAEASCAERETGAFLLLVRSDVGVPGGIPYAGIWRIAAGRAPEKRFEVLESSLASFRGAGDLNGDGAMELITALPNSDFGEADSVRYELVDVTQGARLVLVERTPVVDREVPAPAVYSADLPSGAALVVGDRLLHYEHGALIPAPTGAQDELRVTAERARARIEGVLATLDRPLPDARAGDRCHDWTRLGWAHAFARDLTAVGPWDGVGALADAADLADVAGCFEDDTVK